MKKYIFLFIVLSCLVFVSCASGMIDKYPLEDEKALTENADKAEEIELVTAKETTIVGRVVVSGTIWHPLFIGGYKDTICKKLLKQAKAKYGEDVTIADIDYEVRWRPYMSMLLYFDLLGYVQKYKATANVVVPK